MATFTSNIGISGQAPSVYLTTDTRISDVFLAIGQDSAIYPIEDTGIAYSGATDQKWFFSYQNIGNDVPAVAIDYVTVVFFGKLAFGKTLTPYFKTGGVKYYLDPNEGQSSTPVDFRYGGGGAVAKHNWFVNPATNGPWTTAAVVAGEFGFETNASFTLYGAYVELYWGFGLTPAVGVGSTPADAPCGQSVTLAASFTNYESKILSVTPSFGTLAGGTVVQIAGYNFVNGSTITIGGNPATSVQYLDDQHFVATTPSHAQGFGDIVITEPGGTTVTLRNGFAFTLLIRGTDLRREGLNIQLQLNTGANQCSFILDGGSQPPKVAEKIQIIDDKVTPSRLLFAGNVQRVVQTYEGLNTQLAWQVTSVDFTWLLNRRRPFGTYTLTSVSEIVKDLITRYAPGFTTNHVQTSLAKVSITFDGSADLQTCLSVLARMIGGGHWFVDFIQDVHFFHIVPPVLQSASLPNTVTERTTFNQSSAALRLGPGTAMTVVQGAIITDVFSFPPGMYMFLSTFVYDNGTESAYSPVAGPVALDGAHKVVISNLPIGAAAGALTVVKRRIYTVYNGNTGGGQLMPFCQVNDNVTAGFTTNFRSVGSTSAAVSAMTGLTPPSIPFVTPPLYASTQVPVATQSSTAAILYQTECRPTSVTTPLTWTPGNWVFKVANIYQDLTESQLGPATIAIASDGASMIRLDGIPIGAAINSVPVIARRIYGSSGTSDADFVSWWIIPDNTAVSATIAPATGSKSAVPSSFIPNPIAPDRPNAPVWPNADGPFLEDYDLPDEVVDDNQYLLRDPQVTSEVDLSQIRNRVFVRGAGSVVVTTVFAGATSFKVTECSYYSRTGGLVFVNGKVYDYLTVSANSGPGTLTLANAITATIVQGSSALLYLQLDDTASQQDLGRVELDKDGNPTDGVHEYTIVDQSLVTQFQLYVRGYAELELYSRPITTVRYATRDPKTRAGARVSINLTNPPIVGEFLIQSVIIDQIHDESDELTPRYQVVTSSSKFDLNDLFFQWNQDLTETAAGAGGPNPDPAGDILEQVDALINPTVNRYLVNAKFYIGSTSASFNWLKSTDKFISVAQTSVPASTIVAAVATRPFVEAALTNRALTLAQPSSVATQDKTLLIYPGTYTRGNGVANQPRVRSYEGVTGVDAELFRFPLNPTALINENAGNWSVSYGCILEMIAPPELVAVGATKIYFISIDYDDGSPPFYSRVMCYDFNTLSVTQVGEACGPAAGELSGLAGGGAVVFTSLAYVNGTLLAGVGSRTTGFNSVGAGIWAINAATGTNWTRVFSTEAGAVGEAPMCFSYFNRHVYAGMQRLDAGTARMMVCADTDFTAWTESTSFGASARNAWIRLHKFRTGLYATSFFNNGGTNESRIWRFDGTTWTSVRLVATSGNPQIGVEMLTYANYQEDAKMYVLCINSAGSAIVHMLDSDESTWTTKSGSDLDTSTSCFGVTAGLPSLNY